MFAASNSMECTLLSVLAWTFQNFNDYTHINNLLDDFSAECDDYPPSKTGKLYNDQHSITRCFVAYLRISSSSWKETESNGKKLGNDFAMGFEVNDVLCKVSLFFSFHNRQLLHILLPIAGEMHFSCGNFSAYDIVKGGAHPTLLLQRNNVENFGKYFYCLFQGTLIWYLFLNGFLR